MAMADSLKVYDILKAAHIPGQQARAITQTLRETESAVALDVRGVLDERLQHHATRTDVAELRAEMSNAKAELLRRMFIFWVGQMAATVGIIFTAFKIWG